MSFFTDVLMKCTDEFEGRKCIGNAMYIPLGENNRLKIFLQPLVMQIITKHLALVPLTRITELLTKTPSSLQIFGAKNK